METLRQVLSVLLVFALLGGLLWVLRRGGATSFSSLLKRGILQRGIFHQAGPARGKSLESIERLALTPQHSLHLVRIQGREVVVAAHPQGCALLVEGLDRNES